MTAPRIPRQNPGLRPPGNLGTLPSPQPNGARRASARMDGPARYWLVVLAGAVAVASCVYLSRQDRRMFAEDDATYCRQVHDGAWPDYEHNYAKRCIGAFPRR